MFLIRLCLFVCVNLFLYANCSIPVEKLCVNPACNEPISIAQGKLKYIPQFSEALHFNPGQEITIISKSKKKEDYWGAIINGKTGYVPSEFVKETKIFHAAENLIPVAVDLSQQNSIDGGLTKQKPLNETSQNEKLISPQHSESGASIPNNLESNKIEKPINPAKTFDVIEGTTIYTDEADEITPSAVKSTPETSTSVNSNINEDSTVQTERATVPPELINLNSNYSAQVGENVNNFTIEKVKENDENTILESGDIYGEEDDNEEEEDDGEEDDEGDDEEEEEEMENEVNNMIPNEGVKKHEPSTTESAITEEKVKSTVNEELEKMTTASTQSVLPGFGNTSPDGAVNVENSVTSSVSISVGDTNTEKLSDVPSTQNPNINEIPKPQDAPNSWSILNNFKENLGPPKPGLNIPQQQPSDGFGERYGTPQAIISETPPASAPLEQKMAETTGTKTQSFGVDSNASVSEINQQILSESASPPPQTGFSTDSPSQTNQQTVESTAASFSDPDYKVTQVNEQMGTDAAATTAESHIPESVTPPTIPEMSVESVIHTPKPPGEETPTIFSQISASADALPKDESFEKPGLIPEISENVETFATTPQPVTFEKQNEVPASPQTPNEPSLETIQEKVEATTEASFTPSVAVSPEAKEEPKETPQTVEQPAQDFTTQSEDGAEKPGMLSQITDMFSGWFTSTPKEEFQEQKANFEEVFPDIMNKEKVQEEKSSDETQTGTCENPELGFDCKDSTPREGQTASWTGWIPAGLGVDGLATQSNTLLYLVVTAVTVLLFTLGHNFIEKRGKTGPLIAKINKLEHELLVTSKECVMLKEEAQSAREKITLYENSANDELVVSLQSELEESKKVRSELESSIEVLQQELDAATEAGLDLNKMLSEVLTQKGGSESLLKSVENLQAQLDSQQKVIDEMNKKLGVKSQENEALQSALEAANEKSENLEEELSDIKHNLNIHLKEKEELTKDLNAQIKQLKASSEESGQTKEKEISKVKKQLEEMEKKLSETSSSLTVKEEEVKQLKESMKHLKGKGDVKIETVFDVSKVKAELGKEKKENKGLMEKLQVEENSKKALLEQVNVLNGGMQELKKKYEEAEQKRDEAEKKLDVLSNYFKEKETQLQKELGLQEALWAQKKGDEKAVYNMMKSLQEEVESYKSQNETLKKEILDQERGLKNQIAGLEQKAHENWVAARQAERKLEESKQEMAQLRNRLTLVEKNSSNVDGKANLRSSEELNGVEAASPILHDTSSPLLFPPPLPLDPNAPNLLPTGFMPPPMFMPPLMGNFMPPPPFLPGDRRPPPLGRMSSPPLNNRFSPSTPADYPFERMSSPPLSPSASNYRSLNEDREHYRHRTPPYPPPLHPRNWDDSNEMPGFIPISSQRDSRRDHRGSNISSEHSSSESLDKSSRHSGRV